MDTVTVLASVGVAAPVGLTARLIGGRVRRLSVERRHTRILREFVGAFARELDVGATPVTAAEHALESVSTSPDAGRPGSRELIDRLGLEIRRIRLGAVPGQGPDPSGPVVGQVAGEQDRGCFRKCGRLRGNRGNRGRPGGADSTVPEEGVRRMLAVWSSSRRHGTALGAMMGSLGADLEARLTHLGHTSGALAGARLTETILLLLPLGALGLGQSMGLRPVAFLTGNVLGVILLVGGVLLGCAGALWTESLTVTVLGGVGRRAGPSGHRGLSPTEAARLLDLFAEGLTTGLPIAVAWGSAIDCGGRDPAEQRGTTGGTVSAVRTVAALLMLGAGADAWKPLHDDPQLGAVARLAGAGARHGGRLAEGVKAQAVRLRQDSADASRAGAERVLVVVAAPLTLCFLPAFVLVGLIPLVVGFAGI
ncbi:hypothetical protein [Corynebacterium provencense]|uniref:hypothetical protein n=1 Tax=Corynebacterium provencense TaxID=1737425 RepID=UPI000ADB3F48|nr:hypothetical protein [Corynebacterium provencense]